VLETPQNGATITSPVQVSGQVSVSPFEATLRGRVYDAQGRVLGEGPIMVAAEMGQPGSFSGSLTFHTGSGGAGKVELADISPKDGSMLASATVDVVLVPKPGTGAIEIPAVDDKVTLPLHILAHVGDPGEEIVASLRWQDGTELAHSFTTLRGEDGRGLLVDSLNWPGEGQPPAPATQSATLELRRTAGGPLASQQVTVLSPNDPDAREILLFFVLDENVQAIQARVPRTQAIGTAALEDLLWGAPPPNLAGFETAIPMPQEVFSYPARQPDWGSRVTLRKLTIVDGVATADFSKELWAYGGGSLRVTLIRQQITQTLMQFPTVKEVVITIEGELEGVLEP
jgi:spore germination protein GerM